MRHWGRYCYGMTKISKRTVDALICDEERPIILWDEALSGFGVKALPSGVKRYIVKYRTNGGGRGAPQRWLTLGAHGQLTPDQARGLAQQALAAVARGDDPQAKKFKQRAAPTLSDVWKSFSEERLLLKKPKTQSEYQSQWQDIIQPKLGMMRVESLSRSDVDKLHKSLKRTPYRANRVLALLSRLMSLAETWEWRAQGTNPCQHIERFAEIARKRYLNVDELGRIGVALKGLVAEEAILPTAAHAIELLLLTGGRLNEILSAEWEWVDEKRGLLNLPDSKTGAKPIYLSAAAIDVLGRQKEVRNGSSFIFPSRSGEKHFVNLRKSWVRICERSNVQDARLHDLRHTAASIAVGQGTSLAIVGKLLGHTQAQTTLRYAHVDSDPALRAVNEMGDAVTKAMQGKTLNAE